MTEFPVNHNGATRKNATLNQEVNAAHYASPTMVTYLSGIKFFYKNTLQLKWTIFDLILPEIQVLVTHDALREINSPKR